MKVLLVEDEPVEARALRKLLEKYYPDDIEEILLAGDGISGVELAKQERPDLILMDIHLPGMDGVTASTTIRAMDKDVEIIMLTAYADFEYARRSIGNRVLDYIVKPYSARTLRETMDLAVERIGEKRRTRLEIEGAHNLADMLQREFLHKVLVNFRLRREIIRRYVLMLGIHEKTYRILLLEGEESADSTGAAATELSSRLRDSGIQCMHTHFTRTTCIIPYADRAAELAALVDRILDEWRKDHRDIACLAGNVEEQWEDIAVRFHEMHASLINRDGCFGNASRIAELENNLGEAVISRDRDRASAACRELVDAAYRVYGTSNDFGFCLIAGYRGVLRSIQALESAIDDREAGKLAASFNIPYRGDRETAFADLDRAVAQIISRLDDSVQGNTFRLVGMVKQYIESHYTETITLEALARHVSLSRFHLSRMFKAQENETIIGFMRRVRIENAKRVLLSGGTASEACYKCGFSDPAYFGKTFKRLTGMSPARFVSLRAK